MDDQGAYFVKYINKSENSQVRRTFACTDCDTEWTMWCERDAPFPECAICTQAAQPAVTSPALLTTKSQAVDIAQQTMEDMGYTDFNDNQRKGDIAFKPPSDPTTSEVEAMVRQSVEMSREMDVPKLSEAPTVPGGLSQAQMGANFWSGGMQTGPSAVPAEVQQTLIPAAQMGANIARAEGKDPIAMLHAKRPPLKLIVEASDTKVRGNVNVR